MVEEVREGLKPLSSFPATNLQSDLGCVGYKGAVKSLNEMHDFEDALQRACSDTAQAVYTFDEQFVRKGKHAVPPVK